MTNRKDRSDWEERGYQPKSPDRDPGQAGYKPPKETENVAPPPRKP